MGKNGLLDRQRAANMAFFNAGLQMGRQQILDMMCLALHDPEIMGRDTFGGKRLLKLIKNIGSKIDEYYLAWQKNAESDYWQEKLDDALTDAFGAPLEHSFAQRYEFSPTYDYKTGRWSK